MNVKHTPNRPKLPTNGQSSPLPRFPLPTEGLRAEPEQTTWRLSLALFF